MLSDIESKWGGHLGGIIIAKHPSELASADAKPIYSAPYRVSENARELEKHDNDKVLAKKFIDPDQTEWATTIVLQPKKDCPLRFSAE